ncbi:Arginine utilization regulatory protein RocR [bioreactor metagenome]|uniref:Arginine utilization regulatory protein RocR n=1 Tax=bioreactor metagenome TaxID=1076179 RepID=A0A645BPG1_9ZZZZ
MNNNTRYTFSSIICNSDIMRAAIQKAKKAASFTLLPILIYGETGTGKELFAQSIHNASANKSHPFIAVNCAAIPETLLEITLFGSVRGAFTDAVNATGLFEQAGSGTIFLDEINSMPMSIQPKILRVIQEKSFRKLGSSSEIAVNCRIIASMNRPPLDCIANNTLREDLFYRLSAITIEVPPLRERKEDIETLANYFIQKYSATYEVAPIVMPPKYLEMLRKHSWPGNVRELQNTIESSLVMLEPSSGSFPTPDIFTHYDAEMSGGPSTTDNFLPSEETKVANLKDTLFFTEKQMLVTALNKYSWNISNAAKALGISRSNLQYKIEKFGLSRK